MVVKTLNFVDVLPVFVRQLTHKLFVETEVHSMQILALANVIPPLTGQITPLSLIVLFVV
jgi:hypothetical protein